MTSFGYVIPAFGPFADAGAMTELVDIGEELGFDDVWFGDHVVIPSYATAFTHPDWLDPLTCCFMGLGHTRRLRFGTDVLVAPYRNPVLTAKMAATADHLSGGRVILAFGVGYLKGEFSALGADYAARGDVTDEYLEAIRLLWESDGKPLAYAGNHVSFSDACFGPRPAQDPMPLWVGGNAPRARRRAARLGTGWHPLFPTPEQYADGRSEILAIRSNLGDAAGSDAFTFSYSCGVTALLDREPTSFATGTWTDDPSVPVDFGYAPPLPLDDHGRPRFLGTPEQVAADIVDYVDAGVDHFTLRFANGSPDVGVDDMIAMLHRFTADVAPHFAPISSPSPSTR